MRNFKTYVLVKSSLQERSDPDWMHFSSRLAETIELNILTIDFLLKGDRTGFEDLVSLKVL